MIINPRTSGVWYITRPPPRDRATVRAALSGLRREQRRQPRAVAKRWRPPPRARGQRGGRGLPAPHRFTRESALDSTRPLRVELEVSRRVAREVNAASVRRAHLASARRTRDERVTSGSTSHGRLLEGERERRVRAVREALAVHDRRERAARRSRRTCAARRRDRESTSAERARVCVERAARGGARPGLSAENCGSLRVTRSRYVKLSRATASAALSSSVSAEPTESAQPPPLQCPPHVVPPSALRRHSRAL